MRKIKGSFSEADCIGDLIESKSFRLHNYETVEYGVNIIQFCFLGVGLLSSLFLNFYLMFFSLVVWFVCERLLDLFNDVSLGLAIDLASLNQALDMINFFSSPVYLKDSSLLHKDGSRLPLIRYDSVSGSLGVVGYRDRDMYQIKVSIE